MLEAQDARGAGCSRRRMLEAQDARGAGCSTRRTARRPGLLAALAGVQAADRPIVEPARIVVGDRPGGELDAQLLLALRELADLDHEAVGALLVERGPRLLDTQVAVVDRRAEHRDDRARAPGLAAEVDAD